MWLKLLFHTFQTFAVWAGILTLRLSIPEAPFFCVQMLVPQPVLESAARAARLNMPDDPAALNSTGLTAKQFNPANTISASESAVAILVVRLVISIFLLAQICAAMGSTPF